MHTGDVPRAPTEARDSTAWLALPVVASLAAYAVVVTGGYVWDDYFLIVNSPLVTGQGSWFDHFTQPFSNNPLQEARSFYRPLITLSYGVDHRLWGGWPGGPHLTNLALHTAFVLLLFLLCRRAGAGRPVAAFLATLFALAPRLSESVAWISGRTDIAAGIFALGAVLIFETRPRAWLRRIASGAMLLLGLMCKEVALTAAVALAVLAWLQAPKPRSVARWIVSLLPVVVALATYGVLRMSIMGRIQDDVLPQGRDKLTAAVLTFEAIGRYAGMVLNPFQPRLQIGDSSHPSLLMSAVGVGLVAGSAFVLSKYRHRFTTQVWVAVAWGAASISLVLPAMPLDLNVVAADRFLYLPLAALTLSLTGPAQRLWQRRPISFLLGASVLVVTFALLTSARARRWASEIPLWREAVAQSSTEQPLPRIELSAALMRRARYEEALNYLQQISQSRIPQTQRLAVAVNLATCLDKLGYRERAIGLLEWVVSLQPRRESARVNLMLLQARAHRFEVASRMGQLLLADFPHRRDLPPLVAQLDRTMAEMSALPTEVPGEAADLKARRATLYDRLGALPEALSLWRAVALDGDADVELRLRGAAYVALFGYPEMAYQVLNQLSPKTFVGSQLLALRAVLNSRLADD